MGIWLGRRRSLIGKGFAEGDKEVESQSVCSKQPGYVKVALENTG